MAIASGMHTVAARATFYTTIPPENNVFCSIFAGAAQAAARTRKTIEAEFVPAGVHAAGAASAGIVRVLRRLEDDEQTAAGVKLPAWAGGGRALTCDTSDEITGMAVICD